MAKLAYQRRRSKKLVQVSTPIMQDAIDKGGAAHFEWPRCCEGWKQHAVNRMIAKLGLIEADFDGCSFGVMASPTLLALQP